MKVSNRTEKSLMHNTEDKNFWVDKYGEGNERKFIEVSNNFGIKKLLINPEKESNPHVIDYCWGDGLADLKTQTTPFFTAGRYKVDPRFAVTFNRKDYERYTKYLEETKKGISIFFWIHWKQLSWKEKKVGYLYGIFVEDFRNIKKTIETKEASEHSYLRRKGDRMGNAKSSFILDIRNFRKIVQIETMSEVSKDLLPY